MNADQKHMLGVVVISFVALMLLVAQQILSRKAPQRTRLGCALSTGALALIGIACLWTVPKANVVSILQIAALALAPLFLLFTILIAVLSRKVRRVNRTITRANALSDQGDTAAAVALLEEQFAKGTQHNGEYAWILLTNVAHYSMERKDWPRADDALQHALELAPGDALVLQVKARLLQESGRLDEARELIEATLQDHPKSVAANTAHAKILVSLDEFEQAAEVLTLVDQLLETEQTVDVDDRSDWREKELTPIRNAIAQRATNQTPHEETEPEDAQQ